MHLATRASTPRCPSTTFLTTSLLAVSLSLLGAACGDGAGGDGTDGGTADGTRNPPNPSGLGPAPVDLGSSTDLKAAGSYVILAKTGITNVTGSSITGGHLGLSPAAASFVTGFGLVADSTNVFSTSPSVVSPGRVYASTYASPTPSNLTTAVLDMQTAYVDAAGRSNEDHLNLASGNLAGLTLEPGLYKWGTGVTVPENVTIAGGANDVWIFQISNDLDITAAKRIMLSGGAEAKNIYWQVAGKVTIHENAHFEGIILAQTGITLQTTATMKGRALAQTLVALDNNAISAP
ncbi:MAG: ice-binding family protein [Myxococcota bacterium]|nr:ice-binding family protein [Myxococcota bacterium]